MQFIRSPKSLFLFEKARADACVRRNIFYIYIFFATSIDFVAVFDISVYCVIVFVQSGFQVAGRRHDDAAHRTSMNNV